MSNAMELSKETLEQIGGYVRQNLGTWIRDISPPLTVQLDPNSLERLIRVEEEVKFLRLDMNARFERIDERFEETRADMNARFEAVDRRFEAVDKRFEAVDRRFDEARADSNRRFEEMRADMSARFEAVDKRFEVVDRRFDEARADSNRRFEEMREDMRAGFATSRSHTNHWMTFLTIVLAALGTAMTFAIVYAG